MREYFLKRLLPFILTFVVGAAAGGLFQLFAGGGQPSGWRRDALDPGKYT